jgi:hypothetical protein
MLIYYILTIKNAICVERYEKKNQLMYNKDIRQTNQNTTYILSK